MFTLLLYIHYNIDLLQHFLYKEPSPTIVRKGLIHDKKINVLRSTSIRFMHTQSISIPPYQDSVIHESDADGWIWTEMYLISIISHHLDSC